MNRLLIALKRPLIRLVRWMPSRGHGIHSPFAFYLITYVLNERTPYYKYSLLLQEEKRLRKAKDKSWSYEPLWVKRLLFQLVNHVQPHRVVDAGRLSASALYLQAAREAAEYTGAGELSELFLEADEPVDFLYLHDWRRPAFVTEVFNVCAGRACERSLFVIEGIGYSQEMKELWQRIVADERVGITFDRYDLGLVFFDRTMLKQNYKI